MQQVGIIKNYLVYVLDKETAIAHTQTITNLADTIPLVNYSEEEVLADSKPGRIYHGKWKHSLLVFDQEKPIAIVISYERDKENNDQYPENCLYVSELAVDEKYRGQGIAKALIRLFLKHNKKFLHLSGRPVYKIQTNSAPWNQYVIDLYKSFGFQEVGEKQYENRKDVILELIPNN